MVILTCAKCPSEGFPCRYWPLGDPKATKPVLEPLCNAHQNELIMKFHRYFKQAVPLVSPPTRVGSIGR